MPSRESLHELIDTLPEAAHLLAGGLSSQINKSLASRGEGVRLTARSVGSVLKSLGIRTRRLGNFGRGLTFTSAVRTKIHELARRFGFDRTDFATLDGLESGLGGPPCVLCEEVGLTASLRFIDLQARPRPKFRRKSSSPTSREDRSPATEAEAILTASHSPALVNG